MSENTSICKRGKKPKLSAHINEVKDINITLEKKKTSVKKKEGCKAVQYFKKKNLRQSMKRKDKSQKATNKLSVPNVLLECNKKLYEYQIQQLNLIFKQSLNCPTLTQDELKMLFVKYKSDGHYRANTILPSFTSFLNNTYDVTDENDQFHNQVQYLPTRSTEEINAKNATNTTVNPYCNTDNETRPMKENLSAYGSTESNLQHYLPKGIEVSGINNVDNLTENKHLPVDYNSLNSNYNHVFTNHDIKMYQNNINALNDIQNFNQSRSDSNMKTISDREDHFLYGLSNTENVTKEHYNYRHANRNLLYNIFDSNVQYENLNNNEISQQNEIHNIKYNDLQLNPDFCNDICLNKWNTDKNNNQCYNNAQLSCIPHTNALKSCYNVNNSMTASQMTMVKNYFENEGNNNLPIHTNTYPFTYGKKDSTREYNENINTQQVFNPYFANANTVSDGFTEPNSFVASCVNIADQHI